jgi:hypothetical protein
MEEQGLEEKKQSTYGKTHIGKWYEKFVEKSLAGHEPNDDGYFIMKADEYRHILDFVFRYAEQHRAKVSV